MKAKGYLTNEEQFKISTQIYNDVYVIDDESISDLYQNKFNEEVAKELMLKGEEYVQLEDQGFEHFILTNYSRMINTRTIRQLKPHVTMSSFIFHINGPVILSHRHFEIQGWKHNQKELMERYEKNNWRYRKTRSLLKSME